MPSLIKDKTNDPDDLIFMFFCFLFFCLFVFLFFCFFLFFFFFEYFLPVYGLLTVY